jgi:hypothetical protein
MIDELHRHGDWGTLTAKTADKPLLPVGARTARRLTAVAEQPLLSDRAHGRDLSPFWTGNDLARRKRPEPREAKITGSSWAGL